MPGGGGMGGMYLKSVVFSRQAFRRRRQPVEAGSGGNPAGPVCSRSRLRRVRPSDPGRFSVTDGPFYALPERCAISGHPWRRSPTMRIHAAALALTAALVPFSAYAQDPPAAPPDAQAQDAGGGRGGRAPEPADPALRSRHHEGGEVRPGHLHRPPDQGSALLRDSQGHTREESSCGSARLPRRRWAPDTAGRPQAIAS